MSTEELTRRLKEELICSICLDRFHDPVSIHCGHTFCQACIIKHWDFIDKKHFHCPKCRATSRKRILKPNRELGNIARIVPKLDKKTKEKEKTKEKVCQRHQEPLKLFCKNDQMAICVVCDKSEEHKDHTVFPVEQEFQDQLIFLKKKREKLLKFQAMNAVRNTEALNTIDAGIQKTSLAFKQIFQSLEEQKQLLLAQWHSLQTAVKEQEVHNATISEEISGLDSLITMAEEGWPTLELEFLQKEDSSSPIAKKRKPEDQAADDAFDYSPESRMHSLPSQQPDKKAPVGDKELVGDGRRPLPSWLLLVRTMGDLGKPSSRVQSSPEKRTSESKASEGLHLQAMEGLWGEAFCEKHREPLKVFCWEDCAFICLVCDKSKQHRAHLVLPVEEAAEDYKEDIKAERRKIAQAFQQLRSFLEEQENGFLAQLSDLEKQQDESSTRLSNNISFLNDLICDLEKHCQRPVGEFLQDCCFFNINCCGCFSLNLSIFAKMLRWQNKDGNLCYEFSRNFSKNLVTLDFPRIPLTDVLPSQNKSRE
ncbi:Zinc finger protein RFP, partial [Ophiophagus hannah]